MLKERVITASALALVFLGVLFFLPAMVFGVFISVVFAIGAWEWANLSGLQSQLTRILYSAALVLVLLLTLWLSDWLADVNLVRSVLLAAGGWWAFSLLWLQGYPSSALMWGSTAARLLMGVAVIIPAWLASLYLRFLPDGAWLVLAVVLLVATADIGAYFTGRAFGRRKLAPSVSPGKSWEGVWGGAAMVMLLAMLANVFLATAWLPLLLVVVPTALVSVVGDLVESMVKRHRGMKDSSQILPGHGGIMDRIDGLTAAVPVFVLMSMITHWQI